MVESESDIMISPDRAKEMLTTLGLKEVTWDFLKDKGFGSHELRALVEIARRTETRSLNEMCLAERIKDYDKDGTYKNDIL